MVDINRPVTNPELISFMEKLINEPSPKTEVDFINCMLNSMFLTPIIINGEVEQKDDNRVVLKKGTDVNFKLISNKNTQKSYFLAFTDWEELRKWSSEPENTFIVTYDDLRELIKRGDNAQDGFVINPFGQNVIISSEIIERIEQNVTRTPIDPKTQE